jgi:hypothetical protein
MTDAKKIVAPDELLVPDSRAGLSPRDMVEAKLLRALRAEPRAPGDGNEDQARPRSTAKNWDGRTEDGWN